LHPIITFLIAAHSQHLFIDDSSKKLRKYNHVFVFHVFDGQCVRRTIAGAKQHWSVIGWVTENLLSRAPPCFGKHDKPVVLAVFAVVCTHQSILELRGGLWPVLLLGKSTRKACAPAVRTLIGDDDVYDYFMIRVNSGI
jgi:hypothetical protein